MLDFTLIDGTPGSVASIGITYPTALPAGATYWKYGPSPAGYNCAGVACAAPHWHRMPPAQAAIAGNTVTLSITDGGVGDDDLLVNGVIVDQGGPGFAAAVVGEVTAIPTLGEWGLMLLAGLLGTLGMAHLRRREARGNR